VRWPSRAFGALAMWASAMRELTAYNHCSEPPSFFRQITESATTPGKASLVVEPGPEWAPCLPA
jgi:hypothetical protein